ncbi:hypothetical protein MKX79_04190 [Viridibacillus sp. FSL R5-0468]|uniref:hypothetical protein n=1 Tax=Viridibacillus sp. FSL R5-0468 TaxID=2921640 RepID=UPI0030FC1981
MRLKPNKEIQYGGNIMKSLAFQSKLEKEVDKAALITYGLFALCILITIIFLFIKESFLLSVITPFLGLVAIVLIENPKYDSDSGHGKTRLGSLYYALYVFKYKRNIKKQFPAVALLQEVVEKYDGNYPTYKERKSGTFTNYRSLKMRLDQAYLDKEYMQGLDLKLDKYSYLFGIINEELVENAFNDKTKNIEFGTKYVDLINVSASNTTLLELHIINKEIVTPLR